ncbi:MAG: phosphoglucomutase/phosphomannomutase family protein [Candidatus Omnitrophica bacterium]|nr:phosphoglucomutase/phosphomannomutase family protein [Candidatus Omnitrophota bacterium]
MDKIKFGTDGWRAIISDDFTFDNVRIVAQAISDYLKDTYKKGKIRIIVGYDSRFMSEKYAEVVAKNMVANGISAILTDRPSPTPSVSYAIKDKRLNGGVMITASHNPPYYNGIKYKAFYSGSADPSIISKIEKRLYKRTPKRIATSVFLKSKLYSCENVLPRYLKYVSAYLNWRVLKQKGFKVLVDDMHGCAGTYIEDLLKKTKNKVKTIRSERDAYFGGVNPEPIAKNVQMSIEMVKKGAFDVGLVTDGDVDRIGIIAPGGNLLTGHKVLTLLLLHLFEDRKMAGEVVQTICGTKLIDKVCEKYGLKMHETPVGFKYICDLMRTRDILMGGEEAGGVGFKNYIPERDGILSGLLILEMMAHRKKSLTKILEDIEKEYGSFNYKKIGIRYPDRLKPRLVKTLEANPPEKIMGKKVVKIESYDGVKMLLDDGSWLLLRLSGTEPILRIYSEASSDSTALKMLEAGKRIAFNI